MGVSQAQSGLALEDDGFLRALDQGSGRTDGEEGESMERQIEELGKVAKRRHPST